MFGKLKDKLKSALSIFSRKAEEEAEVKVVEAPKEIVPDIKLKEAVPEIKQKETVKKEVKKVEEKKVDEIKKKEVHEKKKEDLQKISEKKEIIEKKPEPKKIPKREIIKKKEEEIKKEIVIEKVEIKEKLPLVEIKTEALPPLEEKKSFFGKIKDTFRKKEDIKEEIKKEIPAPELIEITEKKIEKEPEMPAESGFFDKLKQAVTTKTISAEKFNELFWDLEIVLLENNVSVEVIEKIKKDLEKELVDKPLPRDVESKILETLKKTLLEILTFEDINLLGKINEKSKQKKPFVIAFFGINGTGKTTSIAKLTHYFQQQKKSVVLAACDTFRAAAIQQLEEHADKLGVKMIKQDYGSDAAAVAFDAVRYAEKNKIDIVMIDTAGRLHSNTNLMAELEKIIRIAKPDFKIFVGESITGNDCIEQAKQFNQLVEMDGAILTKADVDEKGGAPLSIAYTIKKPILFLGVGQRYSDLEVFDAQQIVKRLGL